MPICWQVLKLHIFFFASLRSQKFRSVPRGNVWEELDAPSLVDLPMAKWSRSTEDLVRWQSEWMAGNLSSQNPKVFSSREK